MREQEVLRIDLLPWTATDLAENLLPNVNHNQVNSSRPTVGYGSCENSDLTI